MSSAFPLRLRGRGTGGGGGSRARGVASAKSRVPRPQPPSFRLRHGLPVPLGRTIALRDSPGSSGMSGIRRPRPGRARGRQSGTRGTQSRGRKIESPARLTFPTVMAGLVPAIHALHARVPRARGTCAHEQPRIRPGANTPKFNFLAAYSGLLRPKVAQSGPKWPKASGPRWSKVAHARRIVRAAHKVAGAGKGSCARKQGPAHAFDLACRDPLALALRRAGARAGE